jgi:hypothetical protein
LYGLLCLASNLNDTLLRNSSPDRPVFAILIGGTVTKRIVLIVILSWLVTACGIRNKEHQQAMQSWIGHDSINLIKAWGIPTREYALGDGSKILDYSSSHVESSSSLTYVPSLQAGQMGTLAPTSELETVSCKKNVLVNASGKIQKITWSGNGCY